MSVVPDIRVTGNGALHDRFVVLAAGLVDFSVIHEGAPWPDGRGTGLVIALDQGWNLELVRRRQQSARARRWNLLHCRTDGALGFVGPWVRPNEPGCAACAEWRRRLVVGAADPVGFAAPPRGRGCAPPPWIDALAWFIAGMAVAHQADRAARPRAVYVLHGATLTGQWHTFLPVATCSECGEAPADDARLASFPTVPQFRKGAREFRAVNEQLSLPALRRELCDWRYGVIPHMFRADSGSLAVSVAEVPQENTEERGAGYGRAATFDESGFIAVLEAMERRAGGSPQGRRTSVRGCYRDLRHDAVDPTSFGVHDSAYYRHPAFQLVPYKPTLEMAWVWGYSVRNQRPVLVPEQAAYYNLRPRSRAGNTEFYCYESSNGCALGSGLTEAVLHGLFEVIERDAFLLSWYAQLPVPEVVLHDVSHPLVGFLLDKVAAAGYRMHVFNTTNDFGVPSMWALATSTDDSRPKSYSAAGAHFDPEKALLGAIVETAVNVAFRRDADKERREQLRDMLRDPTRVRTLDDHVDLYTMPQAFDRLSFLLRPERTRQSLEEAFEDDVRWHDPDLTVCLHALTSDILDLGLDVIVVDQTPPEQLTFGLRTVKVLVPGALPMTFGHVYHRTRGLPRLLSAPVALGYHASASTYDELDIAPHPFP